MSAPRIEIDLNANREGFNRARLADADGPLIDGDVVIAYEPEEAICFDAVVDHVDDKYAYLLVEDASMRPDSPVEVTDSVDISVEWWRYLHVAAPVASTAIPTTVITSGQRQALQPAG